MRLPTILPVQLEAIHRSHPLPVFIHAAAPTEELKAITSTWGLRSAEFELFTHDQDLKRLVSEQKIVLLGYRPLRDLQRRERREAKRTF